MSLVILFLVILVSRVLADEGKPAIDQHNQRRVQVNDISFVIDANSGSLNFTLTKVSDKPSNIEIGLPFDKEPRTRLLTYLFASLDRDRKTELLPLIIQYSNLIVTAHTMARRDVGMRLSAPSLTTESQFASCARSPTADASSDYVGMIGGPTFLLSLDPPGLTSNHKPFIQATHDPSVEHISSKLEAHGRYTNVDLLERLFAEQGPLGIVVDVGANIGTFGFAAASLGFDKIIMIEPSIQNFPKLCQVRREQERRGASQAF